MKWQTRWVLQGLLVSSPYVLPLLEWMGTASPLTCSSRAKKITTWFGWCCIFAVPEKEGVGQLRQSPKILLAFPQQPVTVFNTGSSIPQAFSPVISLQRAWVNTEDMSMAGQTRIFSWINDIPSAKNHHDILYPCITTFLAISICLALLDTTWKFDRIQELDAFQWWILPFLNYNLLSINSSSITVLHKRRKSNPLVKALKWQPTHTNDQRGFGGLRQTMTTEKTNSKDWNEMTTDLKYPRPLIKPTRKVVQRQMSQKTMKGQRWAQLNRNWDQGQQGKQIPKFGQKSKE